MRGLLVAALLTASLAGSRGQPLDTWFIFVDDLHVRFMNTGHLRNALRQFAAEVLSDDALFSLHVSGPSQGAIAFTNDRARLSMAINRLTGNGLRDADASAREHAHRLRSSMSGLRQALASHVWREGRPGAMLVLSSRYAEWAEYRAQFQEAVRSLITSDTPIFVIDPHDSSLPIQARLEQGRVTLTP